MPPRKSANNTKPGCTPAVRRSNRSKKNHAMPEPTRKATIGRAGQQDLPSSSDDEEPEHWERDDPFYKLNGVEFDLFSSECGGSALADMEYIWEFGPRAGDVVRITGKVVEAIRACVNAQEAMLRFRTVCFVNARIQSGPELTDDTVSFFRPRLNHPTFPIPSLDARFAIVARPDGNYGIAYTMIKESNVMVDFAEASECREGYITPAFFFGTYHERINPNGGFSTEWKDEMVGREGDPAAVWTTGYLNSNNKVWVPLGQDVGTGQGHTPLMLVKNAVGAACDILDNGGSIYAEFDSAEVMHEVPFVRSVSKASHLITEDEIRIAAQTPPVDSSALVESILDQTRRLAEQDAEGEDNATSTIAGAATETSAMVAAGEAHSYPCNDGARPGARASIPSSTGGSMAHSLPAASYGNNTQGALAGMVPGTHWAAAHSPGASNDNIHFASPANPFFATAHHLVTDDGKMATEYSADTFSLFSRSNAAPAAGMAHPPSVKNQDTNTSGMANPISSASNTSNYDTADDKGMGSSLNAHNDHSGPDHSERRAMTPVENIEEPAEVVFATKEDVLDLAKMSSGEVVKLKVMFNAYKSQVEERLTKLEGQMEKCNTEILNLNNLFNEYKSRAEKRTTTLAGQVEGMKSVQDQVAHFEGRLGGVEEDVRGVRAQVEQGRGWQARESQEMVSELIKKEIEGLSQKLSGIFGVASASLVAPPPPHATIVTPQGALQPGYQYAAPTNRKRTRGDEASTELPTPKRASSVCSLRSTPQSPTVQQPNMTMSVPRKRLLDGFKFGTMED